MKPSRAGSYESPSSRRTRSTRTVRVPLAYSTTSSTPNDVSTTRDGAAPTPGHTCASSQIPRFASASAPFSASAVCTWLSVAASTPGASAIVIDCSSTARRNDPVSAPSAASPRSVAARNASSIAPRSASTAGLAARARAKRSSAITKRGTSSPKICRASSLPGSGRPPRSYALSLTSLVSRSVAYGSRIHHASPSASTTDTLATSAAVRRHARPVSPASAGSADSNAARTPA